MIRSEYIHPIELITDILGFINESFGGEIFSIFFFQFRHQNAVPLLGIEYFIGINIFPNKAGQICSRRNISTGIITQVQNQFINAFILEFTENLVELLIE